MELLVTILGSRNTKNEPRILKFDISRVPPDPPYKFHPRTNLTALLVTIEGFKNKKRDSEF
jgi:hypothetical protein